MIYNKIIGYVLLAIGVIVIFLTLFQSYRVFTGSATAPTIFSAPPPQEKITSTPSTLQEQMQQQVDNSINEQLSKMLPADVLPKALNLMSWSILAGILIFGGGQLARIGIKLIL